MKHMACLGLVAALATDAENLFVLLSAKGLNPKIYVAARAAEQSAEEKMRRAGANFEESNFADDRFYRRGCAGARGFEIFRAARRERQRKPVR